MLSALREAKHMVVQFCSNMHCSTHHANSNWQLLHDAYTVQLEKQRKEDEKQIETVTRMTVIESLPTTLYNKGAFDKLSAEERE
jgi:hypothetical protein